MDLIIALVAFDMVASKFLDAYIISNRPMEAYQERNPILRRMYSLFKIEGDVWLSFFFTILTVGVLVYFLNSFYSSIAYQMLFVLTGLFTTVLNLGSAHSYYFGKNNFITEKLLQKKRVRV